MSTSSSNSSSSRAREWVTRNVRRDPNPYVDELIQQTSDDATQAFRRGGLPNIRSGAQGMGQYGSSRHGIVEGIASGDLAKQLATTSAELRYRDWEQQKQEEMYNRAMNANQGNVSFSGNGHYGTDYSQMALQREQLAQNQYLAEQANALQAMQMMGGFVGQGQQTQMGAYNSLMQSLLGQQMGASQLSQQGMMGGLGALPSFLGAPQQGYQGLYGMGAGMTGFNQQNAQQAFQSALYNAGTNGMDFSMLSQLLAALNPGQFGTTSRDYNMTGTNVGMAPTGYQGPSPNAAGIGSAMNMLGMMNGMMGGMGGGGGGMSGLPAFLQGGGTGFNGGGGGMGSLASLFGG